MKKNLLKVICMAFIAMLCIGLNAQNLSSTDNSSTYGISRPAHLYQAPVIQNNDVSDAVSFFNYTRGNTARCSKVYPAPNGYYSFDVESPTGGTMLDASLPNMSSGDCVNNEFIYFYGSSSTNPGKFYKVNALTGAILTTLTPSTTSLTEMAYDYSTNTMYGYLEPTIYTVNLETGVYTAKSTTSFSGHFFGFAIDLDGSGYGIGGDGNLYSINIATGACALIGSTGQSDIGYIQSMNFDHNTGQLYWAHSGASNDWFRKVNKTTGQTTLVVTAYEMTGLHIPYNPGGADPCPAVTNVTAVQHVGTTAKITWTAPADLTGFIEYKIYDGSTLLGMTPSGTTTFITNPLASGSHLFAVEATYSGECNPQKVTADLTIKTCGDDIKDVAVAYDSDCKATVTWTAAAKTTRGVLFNGGPMITHPGQGAGGKDASAFTVTNQTLLGSNASNTAGYSIADDFILAAASTIETMEFYYYQTSSGTTPPTTGVYVQIWNGSPNAGGSVIWGNLTTNIATGVVFSDIYRVSTSITNADRPLFKVTANIGNLELAAGTYWVEVAFTGNASLTGPWANPVEIMGHPHTGNGLQKISSGWQEWIDYSSTTGAGSLEPLALPFVVYGEGGEAPTVKYNVYMDGVLVANGIEGTTYTHPTAVAQGVDVVWCVAQACPAGGESQAGCVAEKCGATPTPCDKVIGEKAEIEPCTLATITWTAVIGAKEYKIIGAGGESIVTGTTYTEEGEFLEGVTYKWTITTVCVDGSSDPVEVSAVGCLGIHEFGKTVSIYPNPANSTVYITAENFAKVEVYSAIGQLMVTQNTTTVDVSNYQDGIYFFKVFDNNNNTAMKRVSVIK